MIHFLELGCHWGGKAVIAWVKQDQVKSKLPKRIMEKYIIMS